MMLTEARKKTLMDIVKLNGSPIEHLSLIHGVGIQITLESSKILIWNVFYMFQLDDHMALQLIKEIKEWLGFPDKPKLAQRLSKHFKSVKEVK